MREEEGTEEATAKKRRAEGSKLCLGWAQQVGDGVRLGLSDCKDGFLFKLA